MLFKVQLVFEMFNTNLLALSRVTSFFNSLLTVFSEISKLLHSKKIFVTSANEKNFNLLEILGKSFTYSKNNKGPSTDPCGTPRDIF